MSHAPEPNRATWSVAPEDARDWQRMAERVKRDHATMRALLDDVERACRALDELHPESLVRFRDATWMLYVAFDEHLATEEGYFAPILRTVDAWGEMRVLNMINEHNDQRRIILELVDRAENDLENLAELVDEARGLVSAFRLDMESEESSLDEQGLVPSVIRDQEDG
jgi:hemerythrin-like domain-containing protein